MRVRGHVSAGSCNHESSRMCRDEFIISASRCESEMDTKGQAAATGENMCVYTQNPAGLLSIHGRPQPVVPRCQRHTTGRVCGVMRCHCMQAFLKE